MIPSSFALHQTRELSGHDYDYVEQTVNAATINTAGYQRTLCLLIAMFCLRLATPPAAEERDQLRRQLRALSQTMRQAHQGLLYGDPTLDLPGHLSTALRHLYFEPPLQADSQVKHYLEAVDALLEEADEHLHHQHPQLQRIQTAAAGPLLHALDTIVAQYQHESDQEAAASIAHQKQLYQQSCAAAAAAQQKSEQLERTLQELTQAQAQMIQSEKLSSLGQLVAGVAHEINNPVNFIHGNLQHVEEYAQSLLQAIEQIVSMADAAELQAILEAAEVDFIAEDLPKILKSMRLGTERIREIVLSLSRFTRTDGSEVQRVDLHEGLESTLVILSHRLKARPQRPAIEVVREYGELPPVECYAGQLNQVFMNILSNALDAIEEMSPRPEGHQIRIRTGVLAATEAVEIVIADNGPGIAAEHREQIFEPFFTTKPVGKGTGMGMSISHSIITERHGGTLACHSQLGVGTEFVIRIPQRLREKRGE